MHIIAHDQDKFRAAASDGLAMAAGIQIQAPAPGAEEFRGATLQHICRTALLRQGHKQENLMSNDQIAKAALRSMSRPQAMGTDDLTSILTDVANKSLLKAYQEAPKTFLPLTRQVSAPDFKAQHGVKLSEAPDLELVGEHGEYKSGQLLDSQESYSVQTYGKIIYLTRQMIVNDDMRALTRLPQILGAAAARKESDIVWSLILSNPVMSETGKTLFHADHKNLESSSSVGKIDSDKLSAARAAMRAQTGPNGAALNLQPRFLIAPVAQETDTEILLRSRALPQVDYSEGVYNPWANRLTPITEPRLDNDSTKAWYLAADPAQIDILELAYLGESDEPFIDRESLFTSDAVGFKIRHDFGVGIMDFRGLYKNPGE